ncbi:MAG: response regulator [Pseudomonadota bacterium]
MDKKKKVVLVDDEEDFCFFVKANLENTGELDVITAASGKEGIELVLREKPDVVILDLFMPGMSGRQVAETLRGRVETQSLPIIFFTAMAGEEDMKRELVESIGACEFLLKPVTTDRLLDAIRKIT